jgi:shikimate dehydrogenase
MPVKTKHYALFGQPVAQSRSPQIHALFAQQCGIDLHYQAIASSPETFANALNCFAESGGLGANITQPLKTLSVPICERLDAYAQRADAVNTLIRHGSSWLGANTDGLGLVRDLTGRHGVSLSGRRTLLIGAGGAARGVIAPLLDAGIEGIVIANRSVDKALVLADRFGARAVGLEQLASLGGFDLIVHASSSAPSSSAEFTLPQWPSTLVNPACVFVDLRYGEASKPALAWASEHDLLGLDGLGMLVEQAALAFELWHHVAPDTTAVWNILRSEV